MNLKIFLAALAAIYLVAIPANSKDVTPFEDIMALMEGADITYERIGKYTRPFKLKKTGERWKLTQTQKGVSSKVKDAGPNQISVNGFPYGWTVNGTWTFKKSDKKCRIDHKKGGMVMRWDCGN